MKKRAQKWAPGSVKGFKTKIKAIKRKKQN